MQGNIMRKFQGLIAATFSPMKKDETLDLSQVPSVVEHLISDGITGLYVCGSTGEGPLLSGDERRQIAKAYVSAAKGRIPVIVQIGHDSLVEARELATHAHRIGADAISAIAPRYFGCDSVDTLLKCLKVITDAVSDMPFFYYHIPQLSGIAIDASEFLKKAIEELPGFVGIKYSALNVPEFQECLTIAGDRYSILFGCDEMLLSSLAVGSYGSVGSTFNFAAPLYNGIIEAYHRGDMQSARYLQAHSVSMCRLLYKYRGQPAFKAMMGLVGPECGPNRLPLRTLNNMEKRQLKREMEELGFFQWGRQKQRDKIKGRPIMDVTVGKVPDRSIGKTKDVQKR